MTTQGVASRGALVAQSPPGSAARNAKTPGITQASPPPPDYRRGAIVLAFTLRQMQTNPGSPTGQRIRAAMTGADRSMAEATAATRTGFFGSLAAGPLADSASQQALAGMAIWYEAVKPGGPWDFKPQFQAMLDPKKIDDATHHYLPVLTGDAWFPIPDISTYEFYYDIWANIHYGYVGRALDIDEKTLFAGQDLADSLGPIGAMISGNNDEGDNIAVRLGFQLWKEQPVPTSLKAKDLVDAIRGAIPAWLKIGAKGGSKAMLARNNI